MWDIVFGTKHCGQFLPLWTEVHCLVPSERQNSPWLENPLSAGAIALCWCKGGWIHHESSQHSKSTLNEIQGINPCWTHNKTHYHEYFRKYCKEQIEKTLPGQADASIGRAFLSTSLLLNRSRNSLWLSNRLKERLKLVSKTWWTPERSVWDFHYLNTQRSIWKPISTICHNSDFFPHNSSQL